MNDLQAFVTDTQHGANMISLGIQRGRRLKPLVSDLIKASSKKDETKCEKMTFLTILKQVLASIHQL